MMGMLLPGKLLKFNKHPLYVCLIPGHFSRQIISQLIEFTRQFNGICLALSGRQMKKVAILSNPNCGKGLGPRAIQKARRVLWGWPLEILTPASIPELHQSLAHLNSNEYEALIVVGGDGTFHQAFRAMRGLHERHIPIYPFPVGTANDLATELKLRPDWEQVQNLLDEKRIEKLDYITVNDVPFSTIAGIGAGAHLTSEFNSRRSSSSFFKLLTDHLHSHIYSILSARTLLFGKDYFHRLHIRGEGFDEKLKTPVVFICNQPRLGAKLMVAPNSQNNDGRFHVMIVPRLRRDRLITGLIALQRGYVPQDFLLFSTDRLVIRDLDRHDIPVFGDGENLISAPELRFVTHRHALPVYSGRMINQSSADGTPEGPSKFRVKIPEEALL
jgi:diacylglycerol kinase family enzyme